MSRLGAVDDTAARYACAVAQRPSSAGENRAFMNAASEPNIAVPEVAAQQFQVLVVNPPWDVGDKTSGRGYNELFGEMDYEALAALPVARVAADDALLVLWSPPARSFSDVGRTDRLCRAWGFEPSSEIDWLERELEGRVHCSAFAVSGTRGAMPPLVLRDCRFAGPGSPRRGSMPAYLLKRLSKRPGAKLYLFANEAYEGWETPGVTEYSERTAGATPATCTLSERSAVVVQALGQLAQLINPQTA
jgi:N6-adenosine-specific RNA methylase IME4